MMNGPSRRCFCAFCRTERTVYAKKHVSILDASLAMFASLALGFVIWQDVDPRALALFAVGLGIAEIFVLFRRRLSMMCRKCGFDPITYKKSPQVAAERVKTYMKSRRADPLSLLSAHAKLPVLVKKKSDFPRPGESRSASPPA